MGDDVEGGVNVVLGYLVVVEVVEEFNEFVPVGAVFFEVFGPACEDDAVLVFDVGVVFVVYPHGGVFFLGVLPGP